MTLYAESSAVLAWLLEEPRAAEVRGALDAAERVIASDLTLIECDRLLVRAVKLGALPEADAAGRRRVLNASAASWHILHLTEEIVERARRPFPIEPIRTLDAIHLASAVVASAAVSSMTVLSLDQRVRDNAVALGLDVTPSAPLVVREEPRSPLRSRAARRRGERAGAGP